MELNNKALANRNEWEAKGYQLPAYDRSVMEEETRKHPVWVHFGAGNIFRAFQCNVMQRMLNKGECRSGITAIEGFDYEIITKQYRPHDNLSVLVTLKADGMVDKTVIGSIGESCVLDRQDEKEFARIQEIFASDTLQLASFTITEKGYAMKRPDGTVLPAVEKDLNAGPLHADGYLGKVASLLYTRFRAGRKPLAMVSMDNCSRNGEKLFEAMDTYARTWVEKGLAEKEFLSYIEDDHTVSFPWTMIDKITPRPDQEVSAILEKDGLDLTPGHYLKKYVCCSVCEF